MQNACRTSLPIDPALSFFILQFGADVVLIKGYTNDHCAEKWQAEAWGGLPWIVTLTMGH